MKKITVGFVIQEFNDDGKCLMKKITVGFVIQEFNDDGKCLSSEFVAGDQVDWEDDDGNSIDPIDNASYHPLEMVQPTQSEGFEDMDA